MKNILKIDSNPAKFANKQSLSIDLNLQTFTSIIGACILIGTAVAGNNQKAAAQSCNYFAGTAVTGQKVHLNTCSVKRGSGGIVNFTYLPITWEIKKYLAKLIVKIALGLRCMTQ